MLIESVLEASYPGNIGAMEVFKFFKNADEEEKQQFQNHMDDNNVKDAWELIQNVTGSFLQGDEFHNK